METKGHLSAGQVGLRGHSYDDATTLTKRYVIELLTDSGGWLALSSHHTYGGHKGAIGALATRRLFDTTHSVYRIWDSKKGVVA